MYYAMRTDDKDGVAREIYQLRDAYAKQQGIIEDLLLAGKKPCKGNSTINYILPAVIRSRMVVMNPLVLREIIEETKRRYADVMDEASISEFCDLLMDVAYEERDEEEREREDAL